MDYVRNDAPEGEVTEFGEVDRFVSVVLGDEESRGKVLVVAAHQQFAIEDRHNDLSVTEFDRTIDDEYVAIEDAGLAHGIALHPEEIGCGLVADELFVEVDAALGIVIGRRPESGGVGGFDLLLCKVFRAPIGGLRVMIPVHIFYAKLMFLVF